MIDTKAQNLPGEYARMLIALSGLLACWILAWEQPTGWVIGLFAIATARGLGPIGQGLGNSLVTAAILLALIGTAVAFRGNTVVAAPAAGMFILLALKYITEINAS